VRTEPEDGPDVLRSLIVARHEAYIREVHHKINESLQAVLEIRRCRKEIDVLARALEERLKQKEKQSPGKSHTIL
jgi:E3 ubiquitin-protein ligase DOA10